MDASHWRQRLPEPSYFAADLAHHAHHAHHAYHAAVTEELVESKKYGPSAWAAHCGRAREVEDQQSLRPLHDGEDLVPSWGEA